MDDYDTLPNYIKCLEMAGYIYEGNLRVEERGTFEGTYDDRFMKYLYMPRKMGGIFRTYCIS